MMNKVWRSSTYSTRTKLKLYHSCVLTTLLYGSECWRLTEKDLSKLSTFHTKSLQRILRIFWPNVISNKDLFERCGTEPMATILMRRCFSPAKKLPLQKLLCIGRQKGNASGVAPRSHGDGQLKTGGRSPQVVGGCDPPVLPPSPLAIKS